MKKILLTIITISILTTNANAFFFLILGSILNSQNTKTFSPSHTYKVQKQKDRCKAGDANQCFEDANKAFLEDKFEKAIKYYSYGCEQKHAKSCANLGIMYFYGEGIKADVKMATTFIDKGCSLGDENACQNKQIVLDWKKNNG